MKNNTPKLRFPGFNEEWKEQKLGDLLSFKNGINASKEQYGRGVKFVNVLDILNNDFITYEKIAGRVEVDEQTLEKNSVEYGDVLFQRSSETREEVGMANVYLDKNRKATFGGFVIRGKKIGDYNPSFMNKLLKTSCSRKEITTRAGGSTRYNVGQDVLSEVELLFPSLAEQQKIADFFSLLERRIEQQRMKIEALHEEKEGLLKKFFNQELRFKDDKGKEFPKWKSYSFGELVTQKSPKINPKTLTSSTPCIELEHLESNSGRLLGYTNVLSQESIKNAFSRGQILYGRLRPYLKKFYLAQFDGVCSSEIWVLQSTSGHLLNNFLYYLIQSERFQRFAEKSSGSKMPRADWETVSNTIFNIPSPEEQEKISDFLLIIDSKIEKEDSKLQLLKEQKKGFIQQMFI